MKLKEFDILLDIKRHKKIEEFEIVQGDYESNILKISLVEDLNEYVLSGLKVEIAFAKSDGTTVLQDLDNGISLLGNKIICTLKTNTIASPGKVLAEVRVLEETKLLTSSRFSFFVRQAIVNDKTVESTNEFPVLLELISKTNGLIDQVNQIEKQVPEQVITDLAAVSDLAGQLQVDLTTHKADDVSQIGGVHGLTVEYGNFTPYISINGETTGITYGAQGGRYIKIGKLVHYQIEISLTSKGSLVGEVAIKGFPFIASGANARAQNIIDRPVNIDYPSGASNISVEGTTGLISSSGSGLGYVGFTNINLKNDSALRFSGTYETN